jgi:hypothetical protein
LLELVLLQLVSVNAAIPTNPFAHSRYSSVHIEILIGPSHGTATVYDPIRRCYSGAMYLGTPSVLLVLMRTTDFAENRNRAYRCVNGGRCDEAVMTLIISPGHILRAWAPQMRIIFEPLHSSTAELHNTRIRGRRRAKIVFRVGCSAQEMSVPSLHIRPIHAVVSTALLPCISSRTWQPGHNDRRPWRMRY